MEVMQRILSLAFSTLMLAGSVALAADESDGAWLKDRISGIRVWNPDPDGEKVISW